MHHEKTVGFSVRMLNNMIKRDVERSPVFSAVNSTGLHGWALAWFYHNRDRDLFQRDFEERFSIRRSTASNILGLMEKNGLIRRESVAQDKRLKKIVLTEQGIRLHRMIEEDIEAREQRLRKGITEEELACFFRVVDQVKANLEENADVND